MGYNMKDEGNVHIQAYILLYPFSCPPPKSSLTNIIQHISCRKELEVFSVLPFFFRMRAIDKALELVLHAVGCRAMLNGSCTVLAEDSTIEIRFRKENTTKITMCQGLNSLHFGWSSHLS